MTRIQAARHDRTSRNKAVVQTYFAAFGTGDVEGALALIHPQAVWHIDGDPDLTPVGLYKGHDEVRGWLTRFSSGIQSICFEVEHLVGEADVVVALGRFRLRAGPALGMVDSDFALMFRFRDGLISHYQIFEDSRLLSEARKTSNVVRKSLINQTLYAWEDHGAGPLVVLLHGLFLDRQVWGSVIEDLARDHRVVAFDMPGHGESLWREGSSLDAMAEDLALWLAEGGHEAATIVGHSQGGMVAMRLAARHPEAVARLVLVNSSARAEYEDRLEGWRVRREAVLAGRDAKADADPAMRERQAHALTAAVLERGDIRALLPAITAPVTVLSGAMDEATPPELGREIADGVVEGRHVLVEGVGHQIPIQQPEALIRAIRED